MNPENKWVGYKILGNLIENFSLHVDLYEIIFLVENDHCNFYVAESFVCNNGQMRALILTLEPQLFERIICFTELHVVMFCYLGMISEQRSSLVGWMTPTMNRMRSQRRVWLSRVAR